MPKPTLATLIGERIRILRKQCELSQEELAYMSGLHPTYIGQLERGEKNATLNTIEKVANALNVSLEELFQFSTWHDDPQNTISKITNYLREISPREREIILTIFEMLLEWKNQDSFKLNN